jgi:hypothetical protein
VQLPNVLLRISVFGSDLRLIKISRWPCFDYGVCDFLNMTSYLGISPSVPGIFTALLS